MEDCETTQNQSPCLAFTYNIAHIHTPLLVVEIYVHIINTWFATKKPEMDVKTAVPKNTLYVGMFACTFPSYLWLSSTHSTYEIIHLTFPDMLVGCKNVPPTWLPKTHTSNGREVPSLCIFFCVIKNNCLSFKSPRKVSCTHPPSTYGPSLATQTLTLHRIQLFQDKHTDGGSGPLHTPFGSTITHATFERSRSQHDIHVEKDRQATLYRIWVHARMHVPPPISLITYMQANVT